MTAGLSFTDNSTNLDATTMNKLVNRNLTNLVIGGSFESWSAGAGPATDTPPDGWGFTGNGGTISRQSVIAHGYGEGTYYARMEKASGDTGSSRLYQDLTPLVKNNIQSQYFTLSAMIRCDVSSKLRLYFQDTGSAPVEYSDYATASWSVVSLTRQMSASADKLIIGAEAATHGSTYWAYVDKVMLVRGQVAPTFSINPIDRALQACYWSDGGTFTRTNGGLRIEPFKLAGTLTGGAAYEKIDVTLVHGCEKILYVSAGALSFGTTDPQVVSVNCDQYGAGGGETSFDVNLYNHGGNFTASEAYEIRGVAYLLGWDAYGEVFGE